MITANEAKIRSEAIRKENQLKEVEKKIENAVAKGKSSIVVAYLSDAAMEELRLLGYEVKFFPGNLMTDDEYYIGWTE